MHGGDVTAMVQETEICGTCQEAFLPVKEAFEQNFADGLESGASLCVTHKGKDALDLWEGVRNPAATPKSPDRYPDAMDPLAVMRSGARSSSAPPIDTRGSAFAAGPSALLSGTNLSRPERGLRC